ncbi:aldehyde dehydrogenase (NAD+) [Syntrophus gentianae]|uniref:Aldehyde dehydrogenase (NAD+) n=1 Tax=Syntrophus gentianae TaxID=43775 RepID=A0A1H7W2Y1_9BACT|nr:aldehyde dehydrogenase family protein [Syntrophus gentianae]SEM15853.1 aldehyde dehydrogenase (NAD+) [Syntrophus gentianae]
MRNHRTFYIGGQWVEPSGNRTFDVINPATEELAGRICLGGKEDVDRAVLAARKAFQSFSRTSREERMALLERIAAGIQQRCDELSVAITEEMGAPEWVSRRAHVTGALHHARVALETLKTFEFDKLRGNTLVRLSPIGVCGLITPWNWPAVTVLTKVLSALATGCAVILKPSEYSPFSAQIIAELLHDAGAPPGVFNMIYGDGPTVGTALSSHPGIDMISITGSTRAGIDVARNAAATVKRVHQELGGKSPNILLPSADFPGAVERGVKGLMFNAGQTCCAPSRMIVPNDRLEEVKAAAREAVGKLQPGLPDSRAFMGPVVNRNQYDRIQAYIEKGIAEGATVVVGGPGRAEGFDRGYFVKPTVFADTAPEMTIVREEIFGPVLVIQGYDTIEQAVELANDTEYGLAAYLQGGDIEELRALADRIPAGQINLNGSGLDLIDLTAPFGGFKRSGNGRECGDFGFEAFLEPKALLGYIP